MKSIFTATALDSKTITAGITQYSYAGWDEVIPEQRAAVALSLNRNFSPDTAVKIVAVRASLLGWPGARIPRDSFPNDMAIGFDVAVSNARIDQTPASIFIPEWGEWIDLDYVSYPSDSITPAPSRHIELSLHTTNSGHYNADVFNLQAAYIGQQIWPRLELLCEYAGSLRV